MSALIDLTGQRFGRLLVIERAGTSARGIARWRCSCECGVVSVVSGDNLRRGVTRSCGCLRPGSNHGPITHGHTRSRGASPTYVSWMAMRSRCTRPRHPAYAKYGGRGIVVCDRWNAFENFLADMGERPTGKTLDRFPNRDGNYEPGNCRWATPREQIANRDVTVRLTIGGRTRPLSEWAEASPVSYDTILQRLERGWEAERAVMMPSSGTRKGEGLHEVKPGEDCTECSHGCSTPGDARCPGHGGDAPA